MRNIYLLRPYMVLVLALVCTMAAAQDKYWIGGDGDWSDARKWSATPGGSGGAGVPRGGENVHILAQTPMRITLKREAWCRDLRVDGEQAAVVMAGNAPINISGSWHMRGDVSWQASGNVRMVVRREGVELHTRGIPVGGDVIFNGDGSWSMLSDLVLTEGKGVALEQGTLIGNASLLKAHSLEFPNMNNARYIGNSGVLMLKEPPQQRSLNNSIIPGNSILVVDGMTVGLEAPQTEARQRDINICGTEPGQTMFTVDATVTTNYNGFGVSCRGVCNATVTVSVSGGSGNFTYQWLNSGPPSATWTTACGGPQIVIVTDVTQGISCPVSVTVNEPAPLGVIFMGQGTPPTCADVCDGSRSAFAVGGVPPHNYNWNNGAGTSSSFFQLCAGLNTLQITDANNCVFDTTFFFNIQPLQPNLVFTPASCFGECDGTAGVSPSGGTGSISITWSPPPPVGQGTNSVSGLCPGDWSVLMVDANGCDTTVTFTISSPPPLMPIVTQEDASCFGACDGTASVVVTGSTGTLIYSWSPPPGGGQGTAAATGLCEGVYDLTITDQATGCDTTLTITIDAPGSIDPQPQLNDATCATACDGTILLQPTGGTAPFTYVWSPAPPVGQGTASVSALSPGVWQVVVTDAAGCDTTVSLTISAPPPLEPTLSTTDITCSGLCDGAASLTIGGGVPGYTFLWTPAPAAGQGTENVTGLCAGAHTVSITDANGCDTTLTFNIAEPPPLQAIPAQTDVSCSGACDGTASVSVSGGTPGYTYAWSPEPGSGQGTPTADGLCAGAYSVVITDDAGCSITQVFVIEDATPIVVDIITSPASCPGVCDGAATANASGGMGGFTFLWDPAPGAGQGSNSASGFCPGAYSVTITDMAGCDTTITFTIDAPDPIEPNATVNDASCADQCDGSIDLAPAGGTGGFTYLWSPAPPSGQGTPNASGLCPGVHQVTITSGGCDTTVTFTIAAPPPIDASLSISEVTCTGACDGAAIVTVDGGTPGYTYLWTPEPGAGQGTGSASGLCAGDYTLLITDAAGCDTTLSFQISEPLPITADLTVTPSSCGNTCDGAASVIVAGGSGGYTLVWGPGMINGQGTNAVTGLCPGGYTLEVTDGNGCNETFPFTIEPPAAIEVDAVIDDASCSGDCDGSITVAVTGGAGTLTYVWTPQPPVGQGTTSVSGLCSGDIELSITDASGCDTTITFTIGAPDPIIPNGVSTNESCNGPCDGTASVTPSGGVGTFSYLWTPLPPSGQGTSSISGLCPGTWSVTITDAAGCDTTNVFEILPQEGIDVSLELEQVVCAGACTGSATATVSGGVEPYTYTWSPAPGAGQGTAIATGLCAGPMQLTVVDAAGCDTTITFMIDAPPALQADLTVNGETCAGPCTGSASVFITGGAGISTLVWDPEPGSGQGTTAVTGLCSGTTYSLLVTDENGCDTTLTFTVDPFIGLQVTLDVDPMTCAGDCDASVTATVDGGVGPFAVVWVPEPANGQGTLVASGLCAGFVEVTITDAAGCVSVASAEIEEPEPLMDNAVVTHITCFDLCNGSIVIDPTGGVGPYEVYWSPVPPNGQGFLSATDLCIGTYLVQIIDQNGCEATFAHEIFKPDPLELQFTTTQSDCQQCIGSASVEVTGGVPDYDLVWTDAGGTVIGTGSEMFDLCAGLYVVTVTDANGCVHSATVAINDATGEELTAIHGEVTCPTTCDGTGAIAFTCSDPPCTIVWTDALAQDIGVPGDTATDLCAGVYFATVTNAGGCISSVQVNIVTPDTLEIEFLWTDVSCAGECDGAAEAIISGGVPGYTITWDPVPPFGQGTTNISGLCPGAYTAQVIDQNGCTAEATVTIAEPDALVLDVVITDASCHGTCDGAIIPTVSGGTGGYTYVWSPALPQGTDGSISDVCAGSYTLTVTDANGCSISASYVVDEPEMIQLLGISTATACPDCEGTATVQVSGGTPQFSFEWYHQGSLVGTTQTITGLCGGLYTATVSDANACSSTILIIVQDNNAEELTPVNGAVGCSNDCSGTAAIEFDCGSPPCTIEWTDQQGNIIGEDVLEVHDLCVGIYYAQVTNGDGCTSATSVAVEPSQEIEPSLSFTPVSCPGDCDGTATVAPLGGIAPYTYTWDPEPGQGQGTPTATGLCAGIHTLLIEDASGCDTTVTINIPEPQPMVLDAMITHVGCAADCDGSISATVTGGSGAITYSWSPEPGAGQGTAMITGLCAGTYTLTATDVNGCISNASWTVEEPEPITLQWNATPSECGLCIGGVEVVPSGGTGTYTYEWINDGNVVGTDQQLNGLCAGLYLVNVADANNCQATVLVPVSDIDGEILTTTDDVTSCPGACDATASVAYVCGVPPCTVAWVTDMGVSIAQDVDIVTDLCAGLYYVMVTNGGGCVSIEPVVITEPDPIIADLVTSDVSCSGACDGTAEVDPAGGTGPYTYLWQPEPGGSGQGTPSVDGLCAGAYDLTITDANGCDITVPFTINEPELIELGIQIDPISCNGACDGAVEITPTGGNGGYTVVWTPEPPGGQGVFQTSDLCEGTWNIVVTDANGCTIEQEIHLLDPALLAVELAVTGNSCFTSCDGEAAIDVAGGVGPYSIIWSDDSGTIAEDVLQVGSLCAGTYSVTVTDAYGCFDTATFEVEGAEAITADPTLVHESCNGPCDGSVSVDVSGGAGGFTFLWQPAPGAGQGTAMASELCAGAYTLTISDAAGCDTTYFFTIDPFTPITIDPQITPISCAGECDGTVDLNVTGGSGPFSYLWSPEPGSGQGSGAVSGMCVGTYTVAITDVSGCSTSFNITLFGPDPIVVDQVDVIPASCGTVNDGSIGISVSGGAGGYTYQWTGPQGFTSDQQDISGLFEGIYTVTITDASGCSQMVDVALEALVPIEADAGEDQQLCPGAPIVLDGSASIGALTYEWTDTQGNVLGNDPQVEVGPLPPGIHTFTLTITDGPCENSDEVLVVVLDPPFADAGPDRSIFVSGTATLGGSPTGPEGSTFIWSPDSLLNDPTAADPIADPPQTTWFHVLVTGPNGCQSMDSVLVTVYPDIDIPSGLTPNGDGWNDVWVLDFAPLFPQLKVEVYSRWGELLFQSVGYHTPWDGRYSGGFVPVGTYYYVIDLNSPEFPEAFTGPLTVIR